MDIVIKDLEKKDYSNAIDFAIQGMHFNRYMDNPSDLRLYGKYFFYMELQHATQVIAAYMGDKLVGVLMAKVNQEPKTGCSFLKRIFVCIVNIVMRMGSTKDASLYDKANEEMFEQYCRTEKTDGEICFLAADPTIQGKGIGSLLLDELEKREKGKNIHLYTDNNCTYQFYEHRGFQRRGEKVIEMVLQGKNVPLTCFLYSKRM